MLKPLSNHLAVQMTARGKLLGQPVTCLEPPVPPPPPSQQLLWSRANRAALRPTLGFPW